MTALDPVLHWARGPGPRALQGLLGHGWQRGTACSLLSLVPFCQTAQNCDLRPQGPCPRTVNEHFQLYCWHSQYLARGHSLALGL